MAEEKKALRYKMLTSEIAFTDGEIETLTFYDIDKCFDHIKDRVKYDYVNSVQVELV